MLVICLAIDQVAAQFGEGGGGSGDGGLIIFFKDQARKSFLRSQQQNLDA